MGESKAFYEQEYLGKIYANTVGVEEHAFYLPLKELVEQYNLKNKKCLEIGCGRGIFQDMVLDYVGVDLSHTAGKHLHKPFIQVSAMQLPFTDNIFDAIWSYAVLEHIPEPDYVLREIARVLKPGGILLICPTWRVPPWRPKGYEVKKYPDLPMKGKITKLFIRIINMFWMKGIFWVPYRIVRELSWAMTKKPTTLKYVKFEPNFDEYLLPDSDACVSIDIHEVMIWYLSRGFTFTESYNMFERILVPCKPILVFKSSRPYA